MSSIRSWLWALRRTARRGLARVPILPLAGGLWLGCAFPPPSPGWLALPAALGILAPTTAALVPGQVVLGLLLGSLLAGHAAPTVCPDANVGKTTQWIGRVLSIEPSRNDRASLLLELLSGRGEAQPSLLSCRVLVSVGRRLPEVLAGDVVWLPAVDLEPPAHLINPGSGDSAEPLTDRGIERVGSLADGAGVLALEHAAAPQRWLARLRSIAGARIDALPPGNPREIVRALGLGERGAMTTALGDALRDSGLRHLMTLGLLYLSLWMAAAAVPIAALWGRSEWLALRLPARRAAALAILPLPCLYGILGSDPTAGRAMAVGLTVAVAGALGRRGAHPLHLFSLGLISLLCFAPREAGRPALAWSLAALAGIGALAGPVLAAIGRRESRGSWARARGELLRVLTIGAAAFAATSPLQLAQNSHWPWLGIFLTPPGLLLALPTTFLAQSGALASNRFLLRGALYPAALLGRLATAAAGAGRTYWPVPATVAIGAGLLWTLGLAAVVRRRPGIGAGLAALGLAVALCPPLWGALDRAAAPRLRLTFLSVGHGDSMVLETPHGLALLIDAGGSVVGDFDPGREIVVPFLESRGIRKLSAVVLTHPHPDHANGLPSVLHSFEVGELWESGEPCPLPACTQIAALEKTRGTRHLALGAGRFVRDLDGVELTLRSPRLPGGYDPGLGPNDNSLVFGLSYGKFTALLTGDIEATAEERLLASASGTDLSAFLLKAPHHGSDTSSTQAFVDRVHPGAVIFSVGPRNRFNFPRPEVCERYQRIGARSYRTDRDGAVTVETDGSQVWIGTAAARGPPFSTKL